MLDRITNLLLVHQSGAGQYLFCGDAKDSTNETVDNSDTLKRIRGYFDEFAAVLGEDGFKGGLLAIATNSEKEAQRWAPVLNTLAAAAGITGSDGTPPNFEVERILNQKTWVTFW